MQTTCRYWTGPPTCRYQECPRVYQLRTRRSKLRLMGCGNAGGLCRTVLAAIRRATWRTTLWLGRVERPTATRSFPSSRRTELQGVSSGVWVIRMPVGGVDIVRAGYDEGENRGNLQDHHGVVGFG